MLVVVLLAGLLIYSFHGKSSKLPVLKSSDIDKIVIWAGSPDDIFNILTMPNASEDIEKIISMYNGVKEINSNIGTTSDAGIIIYLKDNTKIFIWTLFSPELVTVGCQAPDKKRYQANVESRDLAFYLETIRREANLYPQANWYNQ